MQAIQLDNDAWGPVLYKEIVKLSALNLSLAQREYREFFFLFVEQFSTVERLQFNTLFSRVSYIISRFQLSGRVSYNFHHVRKLIERGQSLSDSEVSALIWCLDTCVHKAYPSADRPKLNGQPLPIPESEQIKDKIKKSRVILTEFNLDTNRGTVHSAKSPQDSFFVYFDERYADAGYAALLRRILKLRLLPLECILIDIHVREDGLWLPSMMVIEPDYLIDVTSVAGCFKYFGIFTADAIIKKYLPRASSKPILIGQAVNHILDGLIQNPEIDFAELFKGVFRINPLSYAVLDDEDIRLIASACHRQYHHLKNVIEQTLPDVNIKREQCVLEPSFYSPSFGIQGRLDVLHRAENGQTDIIELKSGKPFRPNAYGLSEDHYVQTLLYDILIQTTYRQEVDPTCYILYSRLDQNQLRHAPYLDSKIQEAMLARNRLVIQEKRIAAGGFMDLVHYAAINKHPYIKGFLAEHLANFNSIFVSLSDIEQHYVSVFSGFIAREHYLSKMGDPVRDRHGMSALWREGLAQKKEHLSILTDLEFKELQDEPPVIVFNRVDHHLVQFRAGDIIVIYRPDDEGEALSSQLLKGSIVEIDQDHVKVRLRSTPLDQNSWKANLWNIEHDIIDSLFYQLYGGLFSFAASAQSRRKILLGLEPPAAYSPHKIKSYAHLTDRQQGILERMLSAEDYFLLWGPPGTGKTSVMLRTMLYHLMHETNEEVLVIAYTNRAVDEICDQIKSINHADAKQFLRIGSRYSCGPEHKSHLLVQQMDKLSNRAEIRSIFNNTRIVVGTLASIGSKPELWQLKTFSRIIIDEASQILEPQLIGLLAQFKKAVLIGDHKQLPAVSQQSKVHTVLDNDHPLQAMNCPDLSCSLFERLFLTAQKNNWTHAYQVLTHQGRMHVDIMQFINKQFYQETLRAVDHVPELKQRLHFSRPEEETETGSMIWNNRLLFMHSAVDYNGPSIKVNRHESAHIAELLKFIDKHKILNKLSIGIITPFRAQIAQIMKDIPLLNQLKSEQISIDTVERYQGSARDIIIISACCNHRRQLAMISSLSNGVDRKLNVAITRAREQVILIGNKDILQESVPYRAFIERYAK